MQRKKTLKFEFSKERSIAATQSNKSMFRKWYINQYIAILVSWRPCFTAPTLYINIWSHNRLYQNDQCIRSQVYMYIMDKRYVTHAECRINEFVLRLVSSIHMHTMVIGAYRNTENCVFRNQHHYSGVSDELR